MTLFTVQATGTDDAALTRARFVADRFSWPAFVFAWLWLLYHRLWLALAIWVAAEALFVAIALPHLPIVAALAVDALARAFLGLEAHRLRTAKGARAMAVTQIVEARDRDDAEAIFYAGARPGA